MPPLAFLDAQPSGFDPGLQAGVLGSTQQRVSSSLWTTFVSPVKRKDEVGNGQTSHHKATRKDFS